MKAVRRKRLAGLIALLICITLMAAGCSGSENAAMAGDSQTNDTQAEANDNKADTNDNKTDTNDMEEKTTDNGGSSAESKAETPAAVPGVYADYKQYDSKLEVTPIPGGITNSTVLPTFRCTFADMANEAQNALEQGRTFPKDFFRDLTACMLISEEQMQGKEHDAIMFSLSTLAAMANEFWSLEPVLKNVVYEAGTDGRVARTVYNVHFNSADKDGQIIYDNQARKWYLNETEYSSSLDNEQTIAMWWTVLDVANGDAQ